MIVVSSVPYSMFIVLSIYIYIRRERESKRDTLLNTNKAHLYGGT